MHGRQRADETGTIPPVPPASRNYFPYRCQIPALVDFAGAPERKKCTSGHQMSPDNRRERQRDGSAPPGVSAHSLPPGRRPRLSARERSPGSPLPAGREPGSRRGSWEMIPGSCRERNRRTHVKFQGEARRPGPLAWAFLSSPNASERA